MDMWSQWKTIKEARFNDSMTTKNGMPMTKKVDTQDDQKISDSEIPMTRKQVIPMTAEESYPDSKQSSVANAVDY
jgi:hypothetical protein